MPVAHPSRVASIAIFAVALASAASAQTETVLHNFIPATGKYPDAGVIADDAGNLYGTTNSGGTADQGVVFKLDSSGQYTVLHSFNGQNDGSYPDSGVVRDSAGNLYGTTPYGGLDDCGVVYKLDSSGRETILHSFTCGLDGLAPSGRITLGPKGSIYGTTAEGGVSGGGVVFRLDPDGREIILHSFAGPDGFYPYDGVILDVAGNLYGTTSGGGLKDGGVVYKLDASGRLTVLHTFAEGLDGGVPLGGVVRDAAGNLYGTALYDGAFGYGVVFKIDPSGHETVLHNFENNPADGENPEYSLAADPSGNLYGITRNGGAFDNGTIFKIDAQTHAESLVYSFQGVETHPANPNGPILIVNGNFYGTTYYGGAASTGALYKITP